MTEEFKTTNQLPEGTFSNVVKPKELNYETMLEAMRELKKHVDLTGEKVSLNPTYYTVPPKYEGWKPVVKDGEVWLCPPGDEDAPPP